MNKKAFLLFAFVLSTIVSGTGATAGPATDALSKCFADSTTGKDRKDLVRWFFTSLSVHPDIQNLTNISDTTRNEVDKTVAALIERLLSKDCRDQAKNAMAVDGRDALKSSFKTFGELSAYDLMGNPSVNAAVTGFSRYLDAQKLDSALK